MDRTLSFVQYLTSAKDMWSMRGRLIKKWRQSYRLDMIFIDEKGDKIQACVRSDLIPNFEDLLKEDCAYVIRKFGVGEQKDLYAVTENDVKINFYRCTDVTLESWSFDPFGLKLWSFSDILQNKAASKRTVDVMGRIAWCGNLDIFKTKHKESKRLNFDLQDFETLM